MGKYIVVTGLAPLSFRVETLASTVYRATEHQMFPTSSMKSTVLGEHAQQLLAREDLSREAMYELIRASLDEHFHKVVYPAHSGPVCVIDNLVPALRAVTSTRDISLLHQVMWDMNFQENRDQVKRLRPDLYIVSIPSLEVFAEEHRLIDAVARPLYRDMVAWYSHLEFRAKHVPVVRVDAESFGLYGRLRDHLVEVIRS